MLHVFEKSGFEIMNHNADGMYDLKKVFRDIKPPRNF